MKSTRTEVREIFTETTPNSIKNTDTSQKHSEITEKRYIHDMEFLSKAAIDLVELPTEKDIYRFIGECLYELVGNAVILVNSFDEASSNFSTRSITGLGNHLNALLSLLGRHPVGFTTPINDKAKSALMNNILNKVPDGIYELCFGAIPKTTCHAIEELLDIQGVYAVGFSWRGQLFGSAALLLRRNAELQDTRVIETFISQASVALQRRYAEDALHTVHIELEKRVEERTIELAKERAILENIIALNPYSISIHDGKGYYVRGNQAFLELFNHVLPPADCSLFNHPVLSKNGYTKKIARLKKGESVKLPELWYNQRDFQPTLPDRPRCVRSIFFPIMNDSRNIEHIIGMHEDVTERRQAADLLKESEKKYRSVVENANQAIVVVQDEKIVFANPKTCKISKFSMGELIGKPFIEIIHPDYREIAAELQQKNVNREPVPDIYSFRVMDKEGNINWIEVNAVPIDWQGKPATLNFATDITEKVTTEQQMMVKDSALTSSINAIALTDLHGKLTYVNPSFLKLWDYKDSKEVLGESLIGLWQQCADIDKARKSLTKKGEWKGELATKRKDGSVFIIQVSAQIIKGPGGKPLCAMASFIDITERKKAEEDALSSYQQMTKNMEDTIQAMAMTVEYKDRYTASHQRRVAQLARAIADEIGMDENRKEGLYLAGLVHDIGKLRVPAEILSNPGKLSEAEFSMIKLHPQTGYDILKEIQFQWPLAQIVQQHHERIDGSGYPLGLKEDDIYLESKILAVADVVEAMASHRPYRPALGIEKALEEISQHKGTLYDSVIVNACLHLFNEKGFELVQG
jgi:PAS domain S-box-containing protein/putative nucleotidyltransferase with HDIG domain